MCERQKITFLAIETLVFFFLKNKFYSCRHIFQDFWEFNCLSIFFSEADTKKHRYASAKALNAALVTLIDKIIKNDHVINCALFFYSEHGQTSNLIWLSSTSLLIFRLEVANKKSLFSKSGSTWIEISCWKDIIFHAYKILYPTPGCYTGKMCLLMHQKSYKKLILNTSTWYF